ncbi:DnaJ domain protein (fragment) [Planktothrix serta PCC 8927]|uniref:DnaJ domain protein n=1 Tax=Planktothrix serta PCC 8927 TaxID=671068 RepID=A0A7Z9DYL8_9CYAN
MKTTPLPPKVQEEISKLSQKSQNHPITSTDLEKLVWLVIEDSDRILKIKSENLSKNKQLKITEIKEAIYKRFNVKDTDELKKSEQFKMATDGMDKLNFNQKQTWEMLYRKWIDILPDETIETGFLLSSTSVLAEGSGNQ